MALLGLLSPFCIGRRFLLQESVKLAVWFGEAYRKETSFHVCMWGWCRAASILGPLQFRRALFSHLLCTAPQKLTLPWFLSSVILPAVWKTIITLGNDVFQVWVSLNGQKWQNIHSIHDDRNQNNFDLDMHPAGAKETSFWYYIPFFLKSYDL